MISLWIVLALMLATAVTFVVWPLLRAGSGASAPQQNQLNVELHRTRLGELEADLRSGTLSDTQFALAQQDLERDLLQNVGSAQVEAPPSSARPARAAAAVVGVTLPALALGLYLQVGGWDQLNTPPASTTQAPPHAMTEGGAQGNMPSLETMLGKLVERLKQQPDDLRGWQMLARTYMVLERYPEAGRAYGEAYLLSGDDAQLAADYAEALAMANGSRLQGAPAKLIAKALQTEPANKKALWLSGMLAFQERDFARAKEQWKRVAGMVEPNSEEARLIQTYVAQAEAGMSGGMPPTAKAEVGGAPVAAPPPPGAGPAAAPQGSSTIKVSVRLGDKLGTAPSPDDTVFVFARAAQGPRMPLAIVRKQVKDLPITVQLDDSMAMMPAMKLSNFPQVIVGARVSKSGNAMPSSGDLEGASAAVQPGTSQTVQVTIDQVVP